MQKKYTVYRITNTKNQKTYIGAHETYDLDDGYMGSGVYINRAYDKYGVENFKKEILFIFDTQKEMYDKEAELVVIGESSYNIMEGGHGGWSFARTQFTEETVEKRRLATLTPEFREKTKHHRESSSERIRKTCHTPEVRSKATVTLIETMNSEEWKNSDVAMRRAKKISDTLKRKSREIMTPERNAKVSEAMQNRICVTIDGKRRRVLKDDPILERPDIIHGWPRKTN